jgi:hypothetical protein
MVRRTAICSRRVVASLRGFAGLRWSGWAVAGLAWMSWAPVAASCLAKGCRDRPGQPAAGCRPAAAPVIFSTLFTSLRMPNPAMTSKTPTMISQMPTTSANVTIESNG